MDQDHFLDQRSYFLDGSIGFCFDTLEALRTAFETGEPDAENPFTARTRIAIPKKALRVIRLSADELTVIVGLAGGVVELYSVAKLFMKVCRGIVHFSGMMILEVVILISLSYGSQRESLLRRLTTLAQRFSISGPIRKWTPLLSCLATMLTT